MNTLSRKRHVSGPSERKVVAGALVPAPTSLSYGCKITHAYIVGSSGLLTLNLSYKMEFEIGRAHV